MEKFNVPEMDMTGIREAYADLVQAHEDLEKARKMRNRGVVQFVAGVVMVGVGIRMLKNQR